MKIPLWFLFIWLQLFLASDSYGDFTGKGHVHTLSETKQVFLNPHCEANDTCDLKRFTLTTSVDEIWFSDDPDHPTYRNGVIMEYEAGSVDALEKYAIVQFIKGCVFYSSRNRNGMISKNTAIVPSFGEDTPLCFPKWVIDSQDTDPVYNSDPDYGRFYLLRWNKPGSYDNRHQKYYGAEKPKTPIVYMTDYPAGAFVAATGVKNTALRFNTCIFKTRDVPLQTRRDDTNFAKPIACFPWENVYVYDYAQGKFTTDWVDFPALDETYLLVAVCLLVVLGLVFTAVALMNPFGFKQISPTLRSLMVALGSAATAWVFLHPPDLRDTTNWIAVFVIGANVLAGALIGLSRLAEARGKNSKRRWARKAADSGGVLPSPRFY
jgi:hypothetical protein